MIDRAASAAVMKRPRSMPMRRFYRLAMVLPVLLPALITVGVYLFGLPIFWPLNQFVLVLMASGYLGAIPYSLLALWANRWMEGKNEVEIQHKALRAPLFMLAAYPLFVFLLTGLTSESDWLGDVLFALIFGLPGVLVVGYGYVALVLCLRRLVVDRGWLELTSD